MFSVLSLGVLADFIVPCLKQFEMIFYPPAPVLYTERSQLTGLENGEFVLQPKWDGRRAVQMPDGTFRSKRDKAIDKQPWCDLPLPEPKAPMDLELMRDRVHVLDLMLPTTFDERKKIAEMLGLNLFDLNVSSIDEINYCLREWKASGECDGVVLKRRSVPYPLRDSLRPLSDWVKVKRLI